MNLRSLLVRTYPRRWREEYGPELAAILARSRMTPRVIANVLAGSAEQHLGQKPWAICAVCLAVWASGLLLMASEGVVTRSELLAGWIAGQLLVFAAAADIVLRSNSGVLQATTASFKLALLSNAVCVAVCAYQIVQSWGAWTEVNGHTGFYWILKNLFVILLITSVFGFSGASLARIARSYRRLAR